MRRFILLRLGSSGFVGPRRRCWIEGRSVLHLWKGEAPGPIGCPQSVQ